MSVCAGLICTVFVCKGQNMCSVAVSKLYLGPCCILVAIIYGVLCLVWSVCAGVVFLSVYHSGPTEKDAQLFLFLGCSAFRT